MKKNANPLAARAVFAGLLLASAGAAFADTVAVRPGDTLIKIAERELGDRNRFREICELNLRALRHDCNYLVVGMELTLPARGDTRKVAVKSPAPSRQDAGGNRAPKEDFAARFGRSSDTELTAPDGYWAIPKFDYVELSGYQADAIAGGRPGIWLQLPTSIEKMASGKLVEVKAVVRMRRTPGPIALAYSTAEVGNSGWIAKTAGTTFKTVSFTYRVPEMKNGRGDYIGMLPDPNGFGQVLRVAEVSVSVLPE